MAPDPQPRTAPAQPPFVHLRLHSEFSICDSIVRIPELAEALARDGHHACALTDESNLFAMVKFYHAALERDIKPIQGADLWIDDGGDAVSRLTLVVRNREGYLNLTRLLTDAQQNPRTRGLRQAVVSMRALQDRPEGLIALSGAAEGDIGRALLDNREELAKERLERWRRCFGDDFYIELQRLGRERDEEYIHKAVDLAQRHSWAVVATNDVRFLTAEEHSTHLLRCCIQEGVTINEANHGHRSEQQYLRSPAEMAELFADLPSALENSVEIARRCNFHVPLSKPQLPSFNDADGKSENELLEQNAQAGLEERLAHIDGHSKPYLDRLRYELDVVTQVGFAGYFLIVAEFTGWARENDVPVGPGRGSGAGSLVAWSLGITDLDPIAHGLFFERFLNPERLEMPDFDIDFCGEGRDRVIDHVREHHGADRVAQIITFGTMAARAVVRDAARVLGQPYGLADRIAKTIPAAPGVTLKDALAETGEHSSDELRQLYHDNLRAREIIDAALKLEGLTRNAGRHAGGVVIAAHPLTEIMPLYAIEEGDASLVTQLDMNDVAQFGIVKFDFLGLRTLTIIDRAEKAINANKSEGEAPFSVSRLPLDDKKTFALLGRLEVTGVFQLESSGMKELLGRLKPDRFEDITALIALFRPGPLSAQADRIYVERRHGREKVDYLHPRLEPILRSTYGTLIYQEQVLQIAQELAGYTGGRADILRKAMGKKIPEIMQQERVPFVEAVIEGGIEKKIAEEIFAQAADFSGYGFNKSHSAAYALLAYHTAWLKAHHPIEFLTAAMSAEAGSFDRLALYGAECRRLKIDLVAPDINRSGVLFEAHGKEIIYGLKAIRGSGGEAARQVVEARKAGGPFESLEDFCLRVNVSSIGRKAVESWIHAGAFDSIDDRRHLLLALLPTAISQARKVRDDLQSGQGQLFGESDPFAGNSGQSPRKEEAEVEPWTFEQTLRLEHHVVGQFLRKHPCSPWQQLLADNHLSLGDWLDRVEAAQSNGKKSIRKLEGAVVGWAVSRIARRIGGKTLIFIELEDDGRRLELFVPPEMEEHERSIRPNQMLFAAVRLDIGNREGRLRTRAQRLLTFTEALGRLATDAHFRLPFSQPPKFKEDLRQLLSDKKHEKGPCTLRFTFADDFHDHPVTLGRDWKRALSPALLLGLRAIAGSCGDIQLKPWRTLLQTAAARQYPGPRPSQYRQPGDDQYSGPPPSDYGAPDDVGNGLSDGGLADEDLYPAEERPSIKDMYEPEDAPLTTG